MLVIGRRVGDTIKVGDDITIVLTEIRSGNAAGIGIIAPQSVRVIRGEIACEACDGRGHCGSDGLVKTCCDSCRGTGQKAEVSP